MFETFYPDYWCRSVYDIDFARLYQNGIRGLIFDIDNTLVPHGAPADSRAEQLFADLKKIGFRSCLLSNNRRSRVDMFNENIQTQEVWLANKPFVKGYMRAMEKMGTDVRDTVCIGDQLFTDILGANKAGIGSILVNPINPREEIQIILKRIPERFVLKRFRRRDALKLSTSSGIVWKNRNRSGIRGGL